MTANIRLIISDIDGTVLTDQHQVDPALKACMPDLAAAKIPFVLASARSPLGMAPIADQLGQANSPMACYNGALIVTRQGQDIRPLIEHSLPQAETLELLDILANDFPQVSVNLYAGKDWLIATDNTWSQIEADITGEQPQLADLADFVRQGGKVHKCLLIETPEIIQRLQAELDAHQFTDIACYRSKDNYLEVTAKTVSKEHALRELASYYDLPLQAVMSIGDNFNDLPMLELAGLGVAMGNAPEAVKSGSDAITSNNNQSGVAQAIRKYVL